jgi:signal peptidase I
MTLRANGSEVMCGLGHRVRREARRGELQARLVRPFRKRIRLALRFLVVASVVVGLSKASLVEAFFVPSSSMNPTLRVSDYILVPKFLYGLRIPLLDDVVVSWAKPEHGDVIVFHQTHPTGNGESTENEAFVKRVIASESDEVEIRGTQVFVNGVALQEPYARWVDADSQSEYHFGPVTVPPGMLFVLGDNRSNSLDSREWPDHFVPISHVVGKAVMVYWSSAEDSRVRTVL